MERLSFDYHRHDWLGAFVQFCHVYSLQWNWCSAVAGCTYTPVSCMHQWCQRSNFIAPGCTGKRWSPLFEVTVMLPVSLRVQWISECTAHHEAPELVDRILVNVLHLEAPQACWYDARESILSECRSTARVSHIMPALNLALNAGFEKKHYWTLFEH